MHRIYNYIPRNVSFREYNVFISNAAATSAAAAASQFRSSNLTHALLIQISRTSSIIDIVVPSKMGAGGHFVKTNSKKKLLIDLKWPEMRSKVICGHPKWPPKKLCIYQKWPDLRSKVNFGNPKWPIHLKWPEM